MPNRPVIVTELNPTHRSFDNNDQEPIGRLLEIAKVDLNKIEFSLVFAFFQNFRNWSKSNYHFDILENWLTKNVYLTCALCDADQIDCTSF